MGSLALPVERRHGSPNKLKVGRSWHERPICVLGMTDHNVRVRWRRGWRAAVLAIATMVLAAVVLELGSPSVGWLDMPRRFAVVSLHWVKVHWLTSGALSVIVAILLYVFERRSPSSKLKSPGTAMRIKPHQLPGDTAFFTGRELELSDLKALLRGRQPGVPGMAIIAAVGGIGGTGKSALAIRAAHQLSGGFPDGQLYVNLHGTTLGFEPVDPLEALGGFLRALGVPSEDVPRNLEDAEGRYRSLLRDRRMLIVLDNAHSAAQVRPLLPASPTCAVLITSRAPLAELESAERVSLGAMPPHEATQLLGKVASHDRIAADPDAAAEIAAACSHLPLALRIAAGRLAARPAWTPRDLADRLADQRSRLSQLQLGDLAVRASFQVSYQTLPPELARLFRLLGLPEGPSIGVPATAAVLDQPVAEAEGLLEQLVDHNLLESPHLGRYRLHDLLRLFAHEQATSDEPESERTMALQRLLTFYLATTQQADQRLRPGRPLDGEPATSLQQLSFTDLDEAARWLEVERATLVKAVQQAAGLPPFARIAGELTTALRGFFELRSYFADWEQTSKAALRAARQRRDDRALATAHLNLGIVALQRHRRHEARWLLDEALSGYRKVADQLGQARALTSIGNLHRARGEYDLAVRSLEEGLDLRRKQGDCHGEAVTLHILGLVFVDQRDYKQGMARFEQSLALFDKLGDRWGQANVRLRLSEAYHRQGRDEDAIDALQQSLKLSRELGHRRQEAEALTQLGLLHHELLRGRPRSGPLRRLTWINAKMASLHLLAPVINRYRYKQAVAYLQDALRVCRSIKDPYGEAATLQHLGKVLQANGQNQQAQTHWKTAIALFEHLDAQREAAEVRSLVTQSSTPARRRTEP
jgi:tetratricopeptide (TPR) repeat protein